MPNLKKVTFTSELLKRNIKLNVANSAVRTVDKKGGFDLFIQNTKSKNLSLRVKKIKKSIAAKAN